MSRPPSERTKKPNQFYKPEAEEIMSSASANPDSQRGRSKSRDSGTAATRRSSSAAKSSPARSRSRSRSKVKESGRNLSSSSSSAKASSSAAKASTPDDGKKKRPRAEFIAKMGPLIGTFAREFIQCKSIDEMSAKLKTTFGTYRASLAPNADQECVAAAKIARKSPMPDGKLANVASYKGSAQRSSGHFSSDANDLAANIGKKSGYKKLKEGGWSRDSLPFGLIMKDDLIGDKTYTKTNRNGIEVTAKKLSPEPFGFTSVLDCGNCWLCGQKVYSYANSETNTACGECEHVGAITASFFAGMLAIQGNENMKVAYGVADVNCNQRKSDLLSVKFNMNKTYEWVTDREGAAEIATRIIDGDLHRQSYCPEYKGWFDNVNKTPKTRTVTINEMVGRILTHSQLWCDAANAHLREKGKAKGTLSEKQVAASITRILQESIDKISEMRGGTTVSDTPMIDTGEEPKYSLKRLGTSPVASKKKERGDNGLAMPKKDFVVVGPVPTDNLVGFDLPQSFVFGKSASGEVTPSDSQTQEEYNYIPLKSDPVRLAAERLDEPASYEREVLKYEPYSEEYYVNDDDSSQFRAALSEALKHVEYPDSLLRGDELLARLQAEYANEESDVRRIIDNLNEVFNSAASVSSSVKSGMMGLLDDSDDDLDGGSVKRRKTNKKYKYPNKRRNTKRKNHKNKKQRT